MAAVSKGRRFASAPAAGVRLEKVDHSQNVSRYYWVSVSPTLFGEWRLDREWGRIGRQGHTLSDTYEGEAEAREALRRVTAAKAKKGYTVIVHETRPAGTVVHFIPKRAYAYLDLKISTFFRDDLILFNMGLRLYDDGILYVGELVQLSREQLVFYLWGKRDPLRRVQSTTRQTLAALTDRLGAYGLSLGAAVPGWTRPVDRDRWGNTLTARFRSSPHQGNSGDSGNRPA